VTSRRASRQHGFTLLELIVAAGILALIAVFSWRGLDTLIREREAIAASQAAIDTVQRSFARLERDALLASDVELDDDGTMRLVAGAAAADGSNPASVEYRFVNGALTRAAAGVDRAPMVLIDGVAALAMEAWLPATGGGGWVRVKAAATPLPAPVVPGNANVPANRSAAAPLPSGGPVVPGAVAGGQPAGARVVAAATGLRLTFARADGSRVTRSFMVGGG
jgi:general secretion pathway protein J